ncbi:MAG: hypothetical protein QOF49_409, partial [Chloroflexota bacterium]|nr:hypothetical protein [Chloroflexota bacterium]
VSRDVVPFPNATPALIERDEPLAALARLLTEATAGSGRFVVIRGEAGIGKTALLRAFLRTVPDGVTLLHGASDGVSTPRPFGPLEDMVGALGPELGSLLDRDSTRGAVGRWVLNRLAMGGRWVVAIEDIQWADQATLELVAYLTRRITDLPVLMVATYRTDEAVPASVSAIVGNLATLPMVRQIALEPLTFDGVARLAGDLGMAAGGDDADDAYLPARDVAELHRVTAGNPFYLQEVLGGNAPAGRIPPSIVDAVRGRVSRLDDRGRRALEAAAVLGVRSEPWLLAAIAGEDLMGIDDCLLAGLLTKADGVAFRHELTRMAVLDDLPVIRGIALHRRALAALERAGTTDSARLAYHAEGAADGAAVLRHAAAAGQRALVMGARNEAVDQFRRALRFADGVQPADRAGLFEGLAEALYTTSRYAEAAAAWADASAARRAAGDERSAALDDADRAFARWYDGDADEASQIVDGAIVTLERFGDSRELAVALAHSARLGMLAGDHERGLPAARLAMEIGRRVGDARSTADAQVSWATMILDRGDEAGFAALEEAYGIAEAAGLPAISDRALNNLATQLFTWRRLADADRWFAIREAHAERSEIAACVGDSGRGEIAIWRGDWDAGEALLRIAIAAPRSNALSRSASKATLGRLAMLRGADDWRGWLVDAEEIGRRLRTTQLDWPLAAIEAEATWLGEGRDPALRATHAAYEEARERADPWAMGELGAWLWRCSRLDAIDPRAAEPYRAEVGGRAAAAAAIWRGYAMPYEEALALLSSADPTDVGRAHEIFTDLGAVRPAAKAAERLRELGRPVPRGPRPTTRANHAGLTEREAEIAAMLGEGLSNAEIAERLVVSPRTVGHHVSAVLGKLGVRSRAAVASAMTEVGAAR